MSTKVQPKKSSRNSGKPPVMRGCDLKGRGAGLALSLIFAEAGGKGEFIMDGEFVQALLNEMVQIGLKRNLA
jgi:hypothetical protein